MADTSHCSRTKVSSRAIDRLAFNYIFSRVLVICCFKNNFFISYTSTFNKGRGSGVLIMSAACAAAATFFAVDL